MNAIQISLTPDQYAKLLAAVREAGFTDVSSYVAMAALRRASHVLAGE